MTDQETDTESVALRSLAASGLFLAGVVLAITGLIGAARLFDAAGLHGDPQVALTFAVVGVPAVALLVLRRWRALGAGLLVGLLLGALGVLWFDTMFPKGE